MRLLQFARHRRPVPRSRPSRHAPNLPRCGNPPGTYLHSADCSLATPIITTIRGGSPFHHLHWGVGEYDTTLVTAPVATAAIPTAPCTCLTKLNLDDGSVLFQDICTKEAAMATPDELKAQAQGVSPQAQAQPQTQ